jgi:hypothetical protein
MASTPLMPIFKLVPSRGLPYVPLRPLQAPAGTPSPAKTPLPPSRSPRGASNQFSS